MKIGIFGGTFNPPHRGHLNAAAAAIEALGLSKLYVVPTGEPPHKALPEGTPSPEARYRMAQLLFAGDTRISVLDLELRRPGPSYTIDTVLEIKDRHPDAPIYLLMGTDMFLSLETWYRVEELLENMTPAVFARAEGQTEAIGSYAAGLNAKYGVEPALIDYALLDTSSTFLREVLSDRQGFDLVGDTVYREIIRHGYYGAKPAFPWLREQAYAMLKPKRVRHVQGTEEEAVRLAKRWGVPEDLAREAAILHDITKVFDQRAQLRICEKYDIVMDNALVENEKLNHAKTGAILARNEFSICDAVYEAILCHTTGRAEMTLLDKVLYMADYIEPNRDFPGVERLRALAYVDLTAAVAYGLELTALELRERGAPLHPRSEAAAAWLRQTREG